MNCKSIVPILLATSLGLGACASSSGSVGDTAAAAARPLTTTGAFSANIDKADFTVDYSGLKATATMKHRINKDKGGLACVPSLSLEVAKPDGSCKLQLNYEAGFAGEGLLLKNVNFYAKSGIFQDKTLIQTLDCAGWTKEPAKGEVIYTSAVVDGSMPFAPLGQPEAGKASAVLSNRTFAPTFGALTTMKFQGRKFDVDLSKIVFKGDITSTGDETIQCVKTFHDFPKWELEDINPGSPGYTTKYGLDTFKGKKVVVALVSDWCGSCRSQTELMQKLQDKAIASGKPDVVMVVINDKQKTDVTQLTKLVKNIPIFQDEAGVDAWAKMNAAHAGKFTGSAIRNSGYGYAKNGASLMYFAPNGTGSLNLTDFETAVMTVVNAKDEQ